jgi:hypothetical protein
MRLALVVAGILALPTTATAQITVPKAFQIAYAADPQAPCVGFVTIQWDPMLASRHHDGEAAVIIQDGALRPFGCAISLDPQLNTTAADDGGEHRCDIIVHEVKHKAGYWDGQGGVMNMPGGTWPACHPRKAKRARIVQLVRDTLPQRYSWRVSCTPRLTRCKATARGARPVRFGVDKHEDGIYEL